MKTILIVDDNKMNLATAREVLRDEYKIIPVTKGQQALAYLESGECDIILLDINMPEMDGFEVIRRIRKMERCRNIPVIFLTADDDAETESRCFREGAVDFIAKPFVPAVTLSRIGRILELDELRRNLADKLEQKTREVSDMRAKSRQDVLTGLWNRAYAEEIVNRLIEGGAKGALMMMDMDNFKSVNDNYGHIAGDRTLQVFAETLRSFSSEGDILCRLGGDEFLVFVKDETSKTSLSSHAADIISGLRDRIDEFGFDTNLSVSIGIAQTPEDGMAFAELYSSADKALYHVKQNGKNSYHFFSDGFGDEKNRNARTVDLKYLQDLMDRADSDTGSYLLDFGSFHHVYNFIRRFISRSNRDVQMLLFTMGETGNSQLDTAEAEFSMQQLEKAIHNFLRRADVSTRYSSRQLIVILMDANSENGDIVAQRIIEEFKKLYTGGKVRIDYDIARMESQKRK